jgi:hypothetical protein
MIILFSKRDMNKFKKKLFTVTHSLVAQIDRWFNHLQELCSASHKHEEWLMKKNWLLFVSCMQILYSCINACDALINFDASIEKFNLIKFMNK